MFESRITAAVETIKDPVVAPVPAVPGVMPCRAMTTWSTVPGVCSSSNLKTVRTELSSIVLDFHSIIYFKIPYFACVCLNKYFPLPDWPTGSFYSF